MIFTVTLGLIAALELGIILYLLEVIRVGAIERYEDETVLEPPKVSQKTRNKVFGYDIRTFSEDDFR